MLPTPSQIPRKTKTWKRMETKIQSMTFSRATTTIREMVLRMARVMTRMISKMAVVVVLALKKSIPMSRRMMTKNKRSLNQRNKSIR